MPKNNKKTDSKLPPHVAKATKIMIDALRAYCDEDEEVLRLVVLDEDDDPRVKKVYRKADPKGAIDRTLGYLQAIEQSYRVSARHLLSLAPPER